MKVLTPAALTSHGGSLRLLCLVFRTSNPQPRDGPERRFRSRLNALDGSCDPGFAMNEQARRTIPPKRVRYPAGCSFASSCSPPRIAATQLPSATCATTSHRTDFHPPDTATSQTHSFPRTRESRRPRRSWTLNLSAPTMGPDLRRRIVAPGYAFAGMTNLTLRNQHASRFILVNKAK